MPCAQSTFGKLKSPTIIIFGNSGEVNGTFCNCDNNLVFSVLVKFGDL